MRILFAVHAYKPAWRVGGPILSVSALAETLVRKGHEVIVFTSNSNLDEDLDVPVNQAVGVEGVEVWYFRRRAWLKKAFPWVPYLTKSMGFLYAAEMARRLEEHVPSVDAVHTHLPFVYPTWAAARAARRFGKPLFYHQRGVFDPARLRFRSLKKALFIRAVERPTMRSATTLIALTDAEVASYRALGVETPCRVVPNGIDVESYAGGDRRRAEELWGIPRDAQVVLFLGRLHPIKGADRLLDAFQRLATRNDRAVLVLAGPDEWRLEKRFRKRLGETGLSNRVRFPGMVAGREKINLLARADLFVLPSDAEGFSVAMLEALASGTAVLLSPGCHFPEVAAAGAGRIVPLEVPAIAEAVAGLLSNPDELLAMGDRGRALVRARYSWDRITDTMIEVYAEGINRMTSKQERHGAAASG